MFINEDGHLNFDIINKMSCKELVDECKKLTAKSDDLESNVSLPKIPLEDMRKLTKIMFQKKWEEKYGI